MNKYIIWILFIVIWWILCYLWYVWEQEVIKTEPELTWKMCEYVFTNTWEYIEYKEEPFLTWSATRYDYDLDITNWSWWSKRHDTCALRIYDRYKYYKVCLKDTDTCVICYHNDYWPKERTYKIIDLSSHAFAQLAPLKRWVILVDIYKVRPE